MESTENKSGKDLDFSYDDVLAEIEELKNTNQLKKFKLTKDQEKIIIKAREGDNPVSWRNIVIIFRKYGIRTSAETLSNYYKELMEN